MSKSTKEIISQKMKEFNIVDTKTKRTPEELNSIALGIVKDIKKIIESLVLNDIQKVKKDLSDCYKNYLFETKEKRFSLNMFTEPNIFYEELQKYNNSNIRILFDSEYKLKELKNDFNNGFSIINFSILTDLLINILTNRKDEYNDSIVKTDISILIETITSKVLRITNSSSLFLCFVNELKEKYKIKYSSEKNEFISNIKPLFKQKAEKKMQTIKKELFTHIRNTTLLIMNKYKEDINEEYKKTLKENSQDFDKLDQKLNKIKDIRDFYNEIKNKQELYENNLEELEKKCMNTTIKCFFEYYAEKLLKEEIYKSCTKDYILENIILPFKINKIELNNDEEINIIYSIPDNYRFYPEKRFYHTFLGYYLEIKKELKYPNKENYENEINSLFKDKKFIEDFFSIITSDEVSKYFKSKIKFESGYQISFVKDGEYDIYLEKNYEEFLKDMEKNYEKFIDFIIIKQICYKIPAMTNSLMRIYINPLYEISGEAKNDSTKSKSIIKSALFILLVHELAHFLKAYNSDEKLKTNYPKTPRGKESGRCLIHYLFNVGVIEEITYEQSLILNQVSEWKNLNTMRKLFTETKDDSVNSCGKIDFYLAENDDDENIEFGKRGDYCLW